MPGVLLKTCVTPRDDTPAAQMARDGETAELLSQVQVYLPHPNRASGTRTSDHLVHPTALAHLRRRSAFVNDLLRNDSLLDMSNRAGIYRALFDWLEVSRSLTDKGKHYANTLRSSRATRLSPAC
jgi:hypothetical protein